MSSYISQFQHSTYAGSWEIRLRKAAIFLYVLYKDHANLMQTLPEWNFVGSVFVCSLFFTALRLCNSLLMFSHGSTVLMDLGLLSEVPGSQSHTLQSVGLLRTNDRTITEACTWQHTTLIGDINVPGGIRARNLSKREAANTRHKPHGYWDRLCLLYLN